MFRLFFGFLHLISCFLLPVLLIVIIGVVAYSAFHLIRNSQRTLALESPLDILKRRYAKGEITQAEYDEMKKNLA